MQRYYPSNEQGVDDWDPERVVHTPGSLVRTTSAELALKDS